MNIGTWEPAAAAAVVGLACYQLAQSYTDRAPSLHDLGKAVRGDSTHQQLLDTDLTIGSIALVVGVAMTVLTKDITAMLLMLFTFGILSLWHHAILNRPAQ